MITSEKFESLLKTYREPIRKAALAYSYGNREDMEDLISDTIFKAWRKIEDFNGVDVDFRGWFIRIMQRTSLDVLRKRRRRTAPMSIEAYEDHHGLGLEGVVDNPKLLEELTIIENEDLIKTLTADLTPEMKQAALCLFQGLGPEESSKLCNIPTGTMRSRMHRARRKMAMIYKEITKE